MLRCSCSAPDELNPRELEVLLKLNKGMLCRFISYLYSICSTQSDVLIEYGFLLFICILMVVHIWVLNDGLRFAGKKSHWTLN